jgi:predicted permease
LVITLLSVIHKQFSSSAELGKVDPTAFLSVYLLLYPVLQWGIGGWLLAPAEHAENEDSARSLSDTIEIVNVQRPLMDRGAGKNGMTEASRLLPRQDSTNSQGLGNSFRISHILNYDAHHQSATAAAEQEIFGRVMPSKRRNGAQDRPVGQDGRNTDGSALKSMVKELSFVGFGNLGGYEESQPDLILLPDQTHLLPEPESFESIDGPPTMDAGIESTSTYIELKGFASTSDISQCALTKQQIRAMQRADILPLTETLLRISHKVFQPPVIASLLGLFIASFHNLRGTFVNIYGDKGRQAPLQFLFDGIYSVSGCRSRIVRPCFNITIFLLSYTSYAQVGQSAVPINMIILGINLSSTFQNKSKRAVDSDMELSNKTMIAVVVGKMIVMPVIGILSTWFLEQNYTPFPDGE